MRAQAAKYPHGTETLEGLCIDSITHTQPLSQVPLPLNPQRIYQAPSAKQQSPSDQQQQGHQQPAPCQESHPIQTCTLEAGGRLSSPLSPTALASSTSSGLLGQSAKTIKQEQQLQSPVQLGSTQQQHTVGSTLHLEVSACAALTSQSCSVPTDLEVIDQLFNELVILDPKFHRALANAPVIQFETFAANQDGCSNTSHPQTDELDLHRTFMTACEVPDSQQQQDDRKCDNNQSCLQPLKSPGVTHQQHAKHLCPPEVACSTDLFAWKSSSQSGAAEGRATLHSMSLDPNIQQQATSGSTGIRWADGGCDSQDAGAPDHTLGHCRQHPYPASDIHRLSLPLDKVSKLQDSVALAALLSSHQQQIPSLNELKHQMNDVRKLHLSCVTDVSPVLVKLRAQQQQQQQQVVVVSGPQHLDSRARTPRKTGESLPTNRTSPTTPKWQPQMSARQQQAAWQGLPVLQSSKEQKPGQAACKSSIGMRASAPSWKRK